MKMRGTVLTTVIVIVAVITSGTSASGKAKKTPDMVRSYSLPVDKVYAAVVQVASSGFNLKSAVKEGGTVNFFTGGEYSMVISAICRDGGNGESIVTLSIAPSLSNTQLFFVGREKDKVAKRFWVELESTLSVNQRLDQRGAKQAEPTAASVGEGLATVTVKSTPDGADIAVDGKFSGNTSSTLHISAGEHKLTITDKGFQDWERTITLSPGGTITVNAILEPEAKPQ